MVWGALFWKRLRRLFTRWGEMWSNLTDRTAEALAGIRVVKAFAQEGREIGAFARLNRKITGISVRTGLNRTVFFATISFLTGLGTVIIWLFGGLEVIAGRLTLGTLVAFYSYVWMVYGPLEWFGQVQLLDDARLRRRRARLRGHRHRPPSRTTTPGPCASPGWRGGSGSPT